LATFRELKYLPNKFKQMTVQQVADDPSLIDEIYEGLKKMKPQPKYKLPYKKEDQQVELIENIAENYNIDKEHTQAKIVTRHHKDEDTCREFNYLLEAVIAPRRDKDFQNAGEVDIIGNILSATMALPSNAHAVYTTEYLTGFHANDIKVRQMFAPGAVFIIVLQRL
jgi:hypothetical protein